MKNVYKIITLGDQGVGKTSIVQVYINHKFSPTYQPTLGACFYKKDIVHKSKPFSFEIWDTAGQQRYKSLLKLYYRNSDAVLIVFDITNKKSYEKVKDWIHQIQQNCEQSPCIVIVGNKIDLMQKQQVSYEEVKSFVNNKANYGFVYCSAKQQKNIETIFIKVIDLIVDRLKRKQVKKEKQLQKDIRLKKKDPKRKKSDSSCC